MIKALPLILLISLLGCHKQAQVHPGAISNIDSYAYDILLVEQDAITSAKAAYLAGSLPPASKGPLNIAIAQYNVTQASWQAYHAGGGDATKLQQSLTALVAAVGELQKLIKPTQKPVQISWLISHKEAA